MGGALRLLRSQKGAALLELVIALELLAIAMLPFLTALATAARGTAAGDEKTQVAWLLAIAAEETKAMLRSGTLPLPGSPTTQEFPAFRGTRFTVRRTLEPVPELGPGAVRVRLAAEADGRVWEAVFLWHRGAS
ncbi:MAG: hypothetical protein AB1446_11755 [Bacillota bacterium]